MVLPPGRDPVSVPGLDDSVNPKLTRAAGEVAAWIDYLLHPQDNDGPRVYRHRFGDGDSPFPNRNADLDSRSHEYETVSIWEDFAADPDALLRPVQAIAGMRHELIAATYDKLLNGYFTWSSNSKGAGPDAINNRDVVQYFEVNSARMDWDQMRDAGGWKGAEANTAYEYEEAFIKFQVITENCVYIVAEHLARYWAIFDKAGRDLLELMDALTEACADYNALQGGGLTLDIMSVVVSAVIAVTVTVITGPGAATTVKVLQTAASAALSKTLNEATPEQEKHLTLDNHYHLRDTARQYLDGIKAIEQEVADAITELRDHLRLELDDVRARRRYEIGRDSGVWSESIPHVADFK